MVVSYLLLLILWLVNLWVFLMGKEMFSTKWKHVGGEKTVKNILRI